MNYFLFSEIVKLIGHLLIAYTVIMVHYRFWKEHRIDKKVFMEMRKERSIAIVGIIFLLVGYVTGMFFV